MERSLLTFIKLVIFTNKRIATSQSSILKQNTDSKQKQCTKLNSVGHKKNLNLHDLYPAVIDFTTLIQGKTCGSTLHTDMSDIHKTMNYSIAVVTK